MEQFNSIAQTIVDMDPDVSQEEVDALLTQLEALDLDGEEEQNELTGSMVGTGDQSIQMLFAQLQLQLAQQNKQQATDRLNAIQAAQEQSRQVSEYINTARQLYSDALKGMFGSATMLGVGGAGLAVTALVVGLAAGSLVTVLILRRKQRAA